MMMRKMLRRIVDYPYLRFRKGKILDLGCGDGSLMIGNNCVGVDLDPAKIDSAMRMGKKVFLDNVEEHEPKGRYDTVTLIYVLHHTNHPKKVLGTAKTALKCGGNLLIVEAYEYGFNNADDMLKPRTEYDRHKNMIERANLIFYLEKNGFSIVNEFDWFGHLKNLRFSRSFVIIAKKVKNG
jgi:2-polyprenyl-3-methyl-5-hydroxy-6-metoxy-1,4-benzoquinol methylase